MADFQDVQSAQAALPPHLRYHRDEAVVRAEAQFTAAFQQVVQQAQNSAHIPAKQLVGKMIAPLIEQQTTWLALQVADVLRYAQTAFAAQTEGGENDAIGIPADDAAVFIDVLQEVIKLLQKVKKTSPENKGKFLDEVRQEASRLLPDLDALVEAVNDLALPEENEGEDEDEDELFDDDEDDDEPLLTDDEPEETTAQEAANA
jgi:hypothetical protein